MNVTDRKLLSYIPLAECHELPVLTCPAEIGDIDHTQPPMLFLDNGECARLSTMTRLLRVLQRGLERVGDHLELKFASLERLIAPLHG